MSDELTFLPSLRRGLAQALAARDDDPVAPLAAGAAITATVAVEGEPAPRTIRLRGPEAALGLAAAQIVREEPRADSAECAPNFFPFVELAAPDLPWLLTPAAAGDHGRLRPWLVLVVVREQEGVSLGPRPPAPVPVLRIGAPAAPGAELPDLAESWAWAHVQSRAPLEDIETAVTAADGRVLARLVCPRRLLPNGAWLACVVPAFAPGCARGLGEPVAPGAQLAPAWVQGQLGDAVELPVYHSWRFQTGASGDFEALCRRLQPDGDAAAVGRYPLEIGDPGLLPPAPRSVRVSMDGALQTPGVASRPWPDAHRKPFQRDLIRLVDAGMDRTRFRPQAPDPIVAPPLYGGRPAGARAVPADGWVNEVNIDPVRRAAAGLGAAVVDAGQEAFVSAAWDQAGELRATVTALNAARLGAEAGRSLARRAAGLEDADLLQLTARIHAFLPTGATTVRGRLAASALPAGMLSGAFVRQTRPGTPLARSWRALSAAPAARLGADQVRTTLAATSASASADLKPALRFASLALPAGAQVTDATLTGVADPSVPQAPDPALVAELDRLVGARVARPMAAPRPVIVAPPWTPPPAPDVSGIARTVRAVLDPAAAVRASVVERIPSLGGTLASGALPTTLALGPVFEDALSENLAALSTSWMLPGVERLRRNRVRLVEVNDGFVGAFLVGANEKLGRELLWRDYPVDLRATFFHRFWTYAAVPAPNDIGELSGWRKHAGIDANMGDATTASTVIVIRGDLVRRFPSAHVFLQQAAFRGDDAVPVDGGLVYEPIFLGTLDRDTVFFGFEPDDKTVRGDRPSGVAGFFVAIEEQVGAPRLGLDEPRPKDFDEPPASWDDLSWGHLATSEEELAGLTHARAANARLSGLELEGVTWGRNAAHLARACWQRPFRAYIHADLLV